MTLIILAGLGVIVVLLAVAAIAMPSKQSAPRVTGIADYAQPLLPPSPVMQARDDRSLRERELDEDAAALAAEFRRAKRERYIAGLRADAAEYFATPGTAS